MSPDRRSLPRPHRHAALALLATLGALCAVGLPLASTSALGATPRTSLPVIERQVMCVTCKIPLNVAQSPQSDRERAFIQSLINQGEGEAEIKNALVGQYGPAVLGLPADKGFDLTAYLVPLAVVIGLLLLLVSLLPRWRRRAREQTLRSSSVKPLAGSDAARLEADLAKFD
jgi:cytochrome c-type biogenesis protein CcmH